MDAIARYRDDLATNSRSRAFVPLADALRKAGRLEEAQSVLAAGVVHHPDLQSAQLVQARIYADRGKPHRALPILDALYVRDGGNLDLVELYCRLLIEADRLDEAETVLQRAQFIGLPDAVLVKLEEGLEKARSQDEDDDELTDLASLTGVMTLPGLFLEDLGDPFAVPVVAARIARAGRRGAAVGVWREVARLHPAHLALANREIARLSGIAGRVGRTEPPAVHLRPENAVGAARKVRAWAAAIGLEV